MEISSAETAGDFLRHKIDSRDWWIIPILVRDQTDLMMRFENHFYVPDNTALFEVLYVVHRDYGLVSFGFGHKRIASPRSVAQWLRKETNSDTSRQDLEQRDILIMCPGSMKNVGDELQEATFNAIKLICTTDEPTISMAMVDPPEGRA